MLIVFFDAEGAIHREFVPEGQKEMQNSMWVFGIGY